jgi:hypothetical protein
MLLFALHCMAGVGDGLTIELREVHDGRMVELVFHNISKESIELEIPVEGAGDCDKYFEIEAVTKNGRALQKSLLYAPIIPPYTVKLQPDGIYIHQIQPGAYPNAADVKSLQKMRVKYTNPLTGKKTISNWLIL